MYQRKWSPKISRRMFQRLITYRPASAIFFLPVCHNHHFCANQTNAWLLSVSSSSCYFTVTFRPSGHDTSFIYIPAFAGASHTAQWRKCKGRRFDHVHRLNDDGRRGGCRGARRNEVWIYACPCSAFWWFSITENCTHVFLKRLLYVCSHDTSVAPHPRRMGFLLVIKIIFVSWMRIYEHW